MGCLHGMPPWARTVVGTSARASRDGEHSSWRRRCESELSGRHNPVFSALDEFPSETWISLQGEWRGKEIIGAQYGRRTATNTVTWFRVV